jgi:CRP/FNR family cyclic AMP-dependent transcriptional regulator
LAGVDVLRGLTPAELAEVEPLIRVRICHPDQTVLAYQDPTRDVFFLLSGRLRVTIFDADGREVAFRDLEAGQSFGELAAIDGEPRSASVVALTDAVVGAIAVQDFMTLLYRMPALMTGTLLKLCRLVRSLSERVIEFNRPVPVRVCNELLRLAQNHMISERTARLVPAPKHADIASRLNTHREAVSRTMSELARGGILRRGQGELLITDVRRLAEFAARHQGS